MADERYGGMLGVMQEGGEPEEYYEVLQRPLDNKIGPLLYSATQKTPDWLPRGAHWHLWSPSGRNLGFMNNTLFVEPLSRRNEYEPVRNRTGRVPVRQVELAMRQREAAWQQAREFFEDNPWIDLDGYDSFRDNYHGMADNCHDFIDFVVDPRNTTYKLPPLLELFGNH